MGGRHLCAGMCRRSHVWAGTVGKEGAVVLLWGALQLGGLGFDSLWMELREGRKVGGELTGL